MSTHEDLLRELAPQVLALMVRRHGQFGACEDAVQEALLAASQQWPHQGVPRDPRAWLMTVASRRLADEWRSEHARHRREEAVAALPPPADIPATDDTLRLLFLCCHPALSAPSRVALTLRAVGGLSTAQIAKAFLVPEATMAQRISRAKASLRGAVFRMPEPDEAEARLRAVLHVLYLIFNEGYTMSSGAALTDSTLTTEAIRLTRLLLSALPPAIPLAGSPPRPATPAPGGSRPEPPLAAVRGEVTGVLALMLLTDARRPARTGVDGSLIPLSEQDRSLWDAGSIAEGLALTDASLSRGRLGPYQVQAAIAAVHACAEKAGDTDWPQILALYGLLERIAPSPVARLNQAVALAMVNGPQAGLAMLSTLDGDLNGQHRLDAVRAHLLELAGDPAGARASYLLAARRTTSLPEQRYLTARATHLKP